MTKILLNIACAWMREPFVRADRSEPKKAQPFPPAWGHYFKPVKLETRMNLARTFYLCCCLLALQGCFDNSDNETKDNTDGTKSSVQMQEKGADSK